MSEVRRRGGQGELVESKGAKAFLGGGGRVVEICNLVTSFELEISWI